MRKIWDKIVAWLYKIPSDKRLLFAAGFIISAFFAIALEMKVCIVPAIVFGFLKVFFDNWTTGKADWWDFGATVIGGVLCQGFVLLHMWWF